MENCHNNAMVLKEGLEKTGRFNILSKDVGVPVVAFSLKDRSRHDEFEVSELLRRFGWIVPAYTMPADARHVSLLRVVIREDFSCTLAERLVIDITKVLQELDKLPAKNGNNCNTCVNGDEENNGKKNGLTKKTEDEIKRDIATHWMNIVMAKKANKIILSCS